MLTTGIRTPIGIKIFGPDLDQIAQLGEHLESVMREIPGTRSVFAERTTGGYYLDLTPNRAEIARYGLNVEDVLMQVEISIGGMAVARTIEGRERYTINVRYSRELRDDMDKLKRVLVPSDVWDGVGDQPAAGGMRRRPLAGAVQSKSP
jgi:Cu(I)/Ag(I) efflux system membrane protein CusA/SilA